MPAYWIARVRVQDADAYEQYRALAPEALAAYGGRFLARGGRSETLEGAGWPRHVVIEFPDYESALACYRSKEYQAAKAKRVGAAEADIAVVDGGSDA